jgi:hypothetical protein
MRSALQVKTWIPLDSQFEKAAYSSERLEEPWVDTDWHVNVAANRVSTVQ